MAEIKIVVVEDETDILDLVTYHLEQEGFSVSGFCEGATALSAIEEQQPDLVVLDLMLPEMSGTEICKQLKQTDTTRNIPVLILTAKGEEIDRVVGFELGADDYVTKPFSPRELVLRVKAILKRVHPQPSGADVMRLDGLTIDVAGHSVLLEDTPVDLTATEFKLLVTLVERKGRVQTRDGLLQTVWGYDYPGFTRTVDTHMRRLRSKLGTWGDHIETVRGVGYRFREDRA